MRRHLVSLFALALGMAALVGCSPPADPPTGDLSGTVTTGGKPLTGGSITFTPPSGGKPVAATIGYEGTYRATVVPPGEYTVTVETAFLSKLARIGGSIAAAPPEKGEKRSAKKADATSYVQVPKKYERVGETTLKVTVKPGVQTADFDCP